MSKLTQQETINLATTPLRTTVSHSEVDSFLRCERAHFYGYGMGIQRRTESNSLRRGTLGHLALEHFFNVIKSGGSFVEAQEAARAAVTEATMQDPTLIILAAEVIDSLSYFYQAYPFNGWKILEVEYELVIEVTGGLDFPLVIDLIVEDQWGRIWVIDHKFQWDFFSDNDMELQSQLPKYVAALRVAGWKIDKAGYNQLRYRKLKENSVENRYRFEELPNLTDERVITTFREQAITAQRVQERKALPIEEQSWLAVRTQNKLVCKSCPFRAICIAELNNHQPQLILDAHYMLRERREFKTVEMAEVNDE